MKPNAEPPGELRTASGTIRFPAYIPVTTFGGKYPLDDLVRPYLPRLAPAVMVSLYYAKQLKERPSLPLLIDSGGFASLFKEVEVKEKRGLGTLERRLEQGTETTHPRDVLDFQEKHADVAFTPDFPIPPSMSGEERQRRMELTIANALWALGNRRKREMRLYACVQGWHVDSYRACALAYANAGFDGVAIGGLVPRMRKLENLLAIVDAVRAAVPGLPLHAFGVGKPGVVEKLYERGVQSVDSSSYVKMAADGKLWGTADKVLTDASPMERLHLALCNLATATNATMPLSSAQVVFRTQGLFSGPSRALEPDSLHAGQTR